MICAKIDALDENRKALSNMTLKIEGETDESVRNQAKILAEAFVEAGRPEIVFLNMSVFHNDVFQKSLTETPEGLAMVMRESK